MATYSINFYHSLLIGEIVSNPSVQLPTIKQTNLHLNWLDTLLEPVQRLNDIVNLYNNGSSYSFYNNLNTYQLGDRINGGLNYNNVIYFSNERFSNRSSWCNNSYRIVSIFYPFGY